MPTLPAPTQNLTGWQWIAFVAIFAAFTIGQSWLLHRKIDSATAPKAELKPEDKS